MVCSSITAALSSPSRSEVLEEELEELPPRALATALRVVVPAMPS